MLTNAPFSRGGARCDQRRDQRPKLLRPHNCSAGNVAEKSVNDLTIMTSSGLQEVALVTGRVDLVLSPLGNSRSISLAPLYGRATR